MKKNLSSALIIIALVSFQSCQKENISSRPNYYIKATIDGEVKQFSFSPSASSKYSDSSYTVSLIAGIAAGTLENISISITRYDTSVIAGLYEVDTAAPYIISGIYVPATNSGNSFTAGDTLTMDMPFQINVTERDSLNFKGTFSGTFFDTTGVVKKVITGGEFSLQF